MHHAPLVCLIDDDESVRESLPDLLRELGFDVCAFSSAEEFLASGVEATADCLLLDIAMPGMTGLELQRELQVRGLYIPVIFITAQTDERLWRKAIAQGAVECLIKPFTEAALVTALKGALKES